MCGVFSVHSAQTGTWAQFYALASTCGFILLSGYLTAGPKSRQPLFPIRKALQLLIVYVFWETALKSLSEAGNLISQHHSANSSSLYERFFPTWENLLYPAGPILVHFWWLKSYLLVTCMSGILTRLSTPVLAFFSLVLFAANDMGYSHIDMLLKPSIPAIYMAGIILARLPKEKIDILTGTQLPRPAHLACLLLPPLILSLPLPNCAGLSAASLSLILLLAICSQGIARHLPRVRKILVSLAPNLMIFYIIHVYILRVLHSIFLHKLGGLPSPPVTMLILLSTMALSYSVYRLITKHSAILCYLFFCKYRSASGTAHPQH